LNNGDFAAFIKQYSNENVEENTPKKSSKL